MKLLIKKLLDNSFIPTKAHESDAGYDLYSPVDVILEPGNPIKIQTGIAVSLQAKVITFSQEDGCPTKYVENINTVGLIQDRSSMWSKGIKVLGGVVDSLYRGDVTVCLINLTNQPYQISRGDKIAQILFLPVLSPTISVVDELDQTERGENGFGSSGR